MAAVAGAARHCSLVYDGDEEFLAAAVPFLRGWLDAGVPTMAVLARPARERVARALGPAAGAAHWREPADWYRQPARALALAREFAAGGHGCLLGELPWRPRFPAEHAAWARFEALLNVALPRTSVLCAYDARRLDRAVLAVAAHTHPAAVQEATRPSPAFVDPASYLRGCDEGPLPPPPASAAELAFTDDLPLVRHVAADVARAAGFAPDRAEAFVLAVNEAVSNASEHGGGRGMLRVWTTDATLVCEVTNPRGRIDDPFAGHLPPDPAGRRGRGLWLMRRLTDLVEIRCDAGVTVRMHLYRDGAAPPR